MDRKAEESDKLAPEETLYQEAFLRLRNYQDGLVKDKSYVDTVTWQILDAIVTNAIIENSQLKKSEEIIACLGDTSALSDQQALERKMKLGLELAGPEYGQKVNGKISYHIQKKI